jgi:hypothetical protein
MAPLIGGQSNADVIRRGQRMDGPHHLSGGAHQNDCFTRNGHGNCRGTRITGDCVRAQHVEQRGWQEPSGETRFKQGEADMGDKGKKDKGKREQQKKAQLNLKEKRKQKKEKRK